MDIQISIHALLAESDRPAAGVSRSQPRFLSTLSLRRATYRNVWKTYRNSISIHALLAESDEYNDPQKYQVFFISIHALLAESD